MQQRSRVVVLKLCQNCGIKIVWDICLQIYAKGPIWSTSTQKSTWSRALPNDLREHSLDYILIARGSTLWATQLYLGGALPESDYYRLREYKVHQSLSIWLRCPDTWSCKQCFMILWILKEESSMVILNMTSRDCVQYYNCFDLLVIYYLCQCYSTKETSKNL